MMAGLTFTHESLEGGALRRWDLRGPNGMVRFETADALGFKTASAYLHSATAPAGAELEDCLLCGKCWHNAMGGRHARLLREMWEDAGCDDAVIRAQLEVWHACELSSPVPVSEGSQVSGEVGPASNGSNQAATGAGEVGVSGEPVPVAAHYETTMREHERQIEDSRPLVGPIVGDPAPVAALIGRLKEERRRQGLTQVDMALRVGTAQSAISEAETGRKGLHLSTFARWAAVLGFDVALTPTAPVAAQQPELSDELVEMVARTEYAFDGQDIPADLDTTWDNADPDLKNFFVRRAKVVLEDVVPLLRKQWEAERAEEPRWGSGPLVDHNPETPADSRLREAADRAAGMGEVDPVQVTPGAGSADSYCRCVVCRAQRGDVEAKAVIDGILNGPRSEPASEETPGTGSADPDGGVR